VQPETEYLLTKSPPFEKTSDLQSFYQMVKQSKTTNPKDFAEKYLRQEIGDEEWNKPPAEPHHPTVPDKALAFAREVFNHLLVSGGIVEREHDPSVDVSALREKL
jgi:hypothetical protein